VRRAGLASLALTVVASTAGGQNVSLNRPGSGARAAGMGNAFIAVSDDGTAASWNPAGLSQLGKPEFSLVYNTSHRDRRLEGFLTRDQSAVYTPLGTGVATAHIEFASAAVPFRLGRPVTLQIGWRRLYQFTAGLEGDFQRVALSPAARPESALRVEGASDGSVDLWSLAGAIRATDRLSLGWSLDLYRGEWENRVSLLEDPGIMGPTDFGSSMQVNRINGHTWNLGLLLTYPSLSVGLVYHSALESEFSTSYSGRSSLADAVDLRSEPGAYMQFPRSVGVGVAWRARPLLRVALDLTYDQWTDFLVDEKLPGYDVGAVSGFDGLPPELSATRDTVSLNTGMEKLFAVDTVYVPLRLGFAYEPQGARDPFLREDFSYLGVACGTGVNTNSLKLDVALEYRWGTFRRSDNISLVYQLGLAGEYGLPPEPESQGSDGSREWRLKLSVIYRVVNGEKLGGFLKKIFGS
jgi:hypothetical protein